MARLTLAAVLVAGCAGYGTRVGSVPRDAGYVMVSRPAPLPRGRVTADCGPEALAAVLQYHGLPSNVDEITRRIYQPKLDGTLSTALAPLAREKELWAELIPGSTGAIIAEVQADAPCIVMVELREKLFHFLVVVGYHADRQEIVCEDYDGAKLLVSYAELKEGWRSAGHFMLTFRKPTVADYVVLGQDFESRSQYKLAVEPYRKALKMDPGDVDALTGLGTCLYMTGDRAGARETYERALRLAPDDVTLCNNLADLYVTMGVRLDEAERLAERATDGAKKERDSIAKEMATAAPAERFAAKEKLQDAEEMLAQTFGTLGLARAANGRHQFAIAAWQASYDLMPLDQGDRRGRRQLEIGMSYEALSMPREAREHYTLGLQIAKDPALRARLEERLK